MLQSQGQLQRGREFLGCIYQPEQRAETLVLRIWSLSPLLSGVMIFRQNRILNEQPQFKAGERGAILALAHPLILKLGVPLHSMR